ncbi:MAG: gamma-glutamyltransferase [Rhodospirillaceae bacterium]
MPRWNTRAALALAGCLAASGGAQAASQPAVEAANGMVVSSQRLASEAGLAMLQAGGNAVDAAVAVGYALAVVNPCCGNIGGGGFMTIHLAGENGTPRDVFLNFRETAPAAARAEMYLDAHGEVVKGLSLDGYLAAGVPGTVMGLDHALSRFGTKSRAEAMAEAIKLAREGFVLTRADTDIIEARAKRLAKDPEAARIFLRPDGAAPAPGERLVQKDLAATLEMIAQKGPSAFYHGPIAKAVAAASKAHGGILGETDFAAYTVTESRPLSCTYRGYAVLSAPPPSSGGVTLCQMLNVLEGYDLRGMGFRSARSVHLMTEAMRHAYLDRNTLLGDPAFVPNPLPRLLSKDYAAEIRERIDPDKATPSAELAPGTPPHEKPETTHYSVVDAAGNAVAVTYTINGAFGAGVVAPGTGFLLNDEMDDFTAKPGVKNLYGLVQGERNKIAPGKRPLSSMSPSIVSKDGQVVLVLGSPGGSRIITIVLETILNVVDYGMAPQEAVDAPRIHHQWLPDTLFYEPFGLSPDTIERLEAMGHTLKEQKPWGAAELIQVGGKGPAQKDAAAPVNDAALSGAVRSGFLYGANDARRPAGAAVGY